ncbi:hypothetical protein [Pseudobacteroides cellulosolvens]|uniref:Lipoprotein n=1 Tax=Pseudobacteroides cellulosolvens ATCC 35603 = DSM 2933 TaxID=398512 RepID=A0A0L6JIM5_9FIRM|nr:hypothetical protein [Pseudobacteroides cellulosolvens]KNY25553.1 hypothetical protein Bccel_0813 [Pseudobacteroides cellulosolvens ATCC 35603 = DSM 2933]
MGKIIFIVLLIVFLFVGCNNTSQITNETPKNDLITGVPEDIRPTPSKENLYEPNYKDISLKTDVSDLKEISEELFDMYLKSFTESKVIEYARISDYKVEDIKIEHGNIDKFQFYVRYSIKPASEKYVIAGNGIYESDGWIGHRVYFINVKKEEDGFKILSIGTGP